MVRHPGMDLTLACLDQAWPLGLEAMMVLMNHNRKETSSMQLMSMSTHSPGKQDANHILQSTREKGTILGLTPEYR